MLPLIYSCNFEDYNVLNFKAHFIFSILAYQQTGKDALLCNTDISKILNLHRECNKRYKSFKLLDIHPFHHSLTNSFDTKYIQKIQIIIFIQHSNIYKRNMHPINLNNFRRNDLFNVISYSPLSHDNAKTIFIKRFYENISKLIVYSNKFNCDIFLWNVISNNMIP